MPTTSPYTPWLLGGGVLLLGLAFTGVLTATSGTQTATSAHSQTFESKVSIPQAGPHRIKVTTSSHAPLRDGFPLCSLSLLLDGTLMLGQSTLVGPTPNITVFTTELEQGAYDLVFEATCAGGGTGSSAAPFSVEISAQPADVGTTAADASSVDTWLSVAPTPSTRARYPSLEAYAG